MLRFQHLLDSQTEFKVKRSLLNSDELAFVQNLNDMPIAAFYFISHDSYLSIGCMSASERDYFDNHRSVEFIPSVEPTLSNKQIFIMFLKKHRKYAAYKRNYAQFHHSYQDDSGVADFLMSAYDWISTPEGYSYWCSTHYVWMDMVENLNLNNRS